MAAALLDPFKFEFFSTDDKIRTENPSTRVLSFVEIGQTSAEISRFFFRFKRGHTDRHTDAADHRIHPRLRHGRRPWVTDTPTL